MTYATYCPEDDKLRLYCGRVDRPEYDRLRAEGWQATPKQDCDFSATWSIPRKRTAEKYAVDGIIEDEDQTPDERAVARAERFGDYRDKRLSEAVGQADRYDAGPMAHGYQNHARAERAAARHDRVADHALDAWSKAEYWTHRTAGVISHALYKSSPAVRMGRIMEIEKDLRKVQIQREERETLYAFWKDIAADTDQEKQTKRAKLVAERMNWHYAYQHPREAYKNSLSSLLSDRNPITGAEAAEMFLKSCRLPGTKSEWEMHLELRLTYENQMLEAAGGRAGTIEMIPGGFIGTKQIYKVNKSSVTGRVTSVDVRIAPTTGWTYRVKRGTEYSLENIDTERLAPSAYRPPTDEELAAYTAARKAEKAAKPKKEAPPLINPTDADAERLALAWQRIQQSTRDKYSRDAVLLPVTRMTQAQYSEQSQGTYGRAKTVDLYQDGKTTRGGNYYSKRDLQASQPVLAKVRRMSVSDGWSVIIITDKPQKPFPAELWEAAPQTAAV